MKRSFALVVALGTLSGPWACGNSPLGPSPVPLGDWGGDHVLMTVSPTETHLEFDCAHGDIAGVLAADSNHQFSVTGTFVRDHGAPIREDQPVDTHPAVYAGSVQSNTMALTVRLTDTGEVIGSFTLVRGALARVVKCL